MAQASAGPEIIPLLPVAKTITMTLVPDWNQQDLRSPKHPACVCVVLGPANTRPENAPWKFEFNLYAMDQLTGPDKKPNEKTVSKDSRALLWQSGKPFDGYSHVVVAKGCKLSDTDDLKTRSVVFRASTEEKDPNALIYVRRSGKTVGYLKVVQGYHYYFNITFEAGSAIAQKVAKESWRPIVYLISKRPGREATDFITGSRQFTNFITNWAEGVEIDADPDERTNAFQCAIQDRQDVEGKSVDEKHPSKDEKRVTSKDDLEPRRPLPTVAANTPPPPVSEYGSQYLVLQWEVNHKPAEKIVLPALETNCWTVPFSLESRVDSFSDDSLARFMLATELTARNLAVDTKQPTCESARQFLSCLSAINQIHGWQHVSWFIRDSDAYIAATKVAAQHDTWPRGVMDEFQLRGQALLKRVCHRIWWVSEMVRQSGNAFDPTIAVKIFAADHQWSANATAFMKEAESQITELLARNSEGFQRFRVLQRQGVQWPHSQKLRQEIEAAKFTFRPMVIKRDRCVCNVCGVEVNGWRSWHNPWSFHDYSRHPKQFSDEKHTLSK